MHLLIISLLAVSLEVVRGATTCPTPAAATTTEQTYTITGTGAAVDCVVTFTTADKNSLIQVTVIKATGVTGASDYINLRDSQVQSTKNFEQDAQFTSSNSTMYAEFKVATLADAQKIELKYKETNSAVCPTSGTIMITATTVDQMYAFVASTTALAAGITCKYQIDGMADKALYVKFATYSVTGDASENYISLSSSSATDTDVAYKGNSPALNTYYKASATKFYLDVHFKTLALDEGFTFYIKSADIIFKPCTVIIGLLMALTSLYNRF